VQQDEFSDAELIVFGHGSTVNEQSSAPVYQHAEGLRKRGLFKSVREAFWKQAPQLEEVFAAPSAARVFLAPLFISDGYFSEQVIPEALEFRRPNQPGEFNRILRRGEQTLFYCRAVGSHPAMAKVVKDRAREVFARFPFPAPPRTEETTLFIVGHGTEQDSNSRGAIDLQVEQLRAEGTYRAVHAVFLDEDPRIPECYRLCQTRNLIVVPFFISDGMHVREDIPVLLGEPKRIVEQRLAAGTATWRNPTEKQGKLVWYTASVGTDPLVAEVILERVRQAAVETHD
jgi:sirohydrochlorin cobaltochelatase